MSLRPSLGALVLLLGLGACSSAAATRVAVSGTDDACSPAETKLAAGKTTFDFTNSASDINELYILRADDTVVAEVENVTTGTGRALTASLVAGEYTLVCKPGQKGDGFRSTITVTGSGGEAVPEPDQAIAVVSRDYAFDVPSAFKITTGETIRFVLKNEGTVEHEMEIVDADVQPLGEVHSLKPGTEGELTMTFKKAGTYVMRCILKTSNGKSHDTLGMTHQLVVGE